MSDRTFKDRAKGAAHKVNKTIRSTLGYETKSIKDIQPSISVDPHFFSAPSIEGTTYSNLIKKQKESSTIQEARELFKKGIEQDNNKNYSEAFKLYMNGLDKIVPTLKTIEDESLKMVLKQEILKFMKRSEELKPLIKEELSDLNFPKIPESKDDKNLNFPDVPNPQFIFSSENSNYDNIPDVPNLPNFHHSTNDIPSFPDIPDLPQFFPSNVKLDNNNNFDEKLFKL